jgi:hypothetical protein
MRADSATKVASHEAAHAPHGTEAAPRPRTLDDLARLDARALERVYRAAKTPRVEDLEGRLRGRMLAVAGAPGVAALGGLLERANLFPWQGKTFQTLAPGHGEGLNRVLGDRASWFRFTTSVGKSRAGDFDAVQLDYDHPENPALVRAIRDEVREVAPGLWLGQAYFELRTKLLFVVNVNVPARLVLYFALARP